VKRPEGFGSQRGQAPERRAAPADEPAKAPRPAKAAKPARAPRPERAQKPTRTPREPRIRPSRADRPDAGARAELAKAARERRKAERAEVRRFTRRQRNRRIAWLTVAGVVAVLVGLVLVAVYSPLLALRTIVVEGTSRIPAADVQAAVSHQVGTPLALLDFDRLEQDLTAFPLIRSYTTKAVPPDTLVIQIVERQPVGQVAVAGGFELVDPAGVTIAQSPERVTGYPFIDARGDLQGTAFRSMVEVLLALPADLLATVDSVAATTQDDVSLVLTGVGQQVRWGSAEDSATKAKVLAALIAVTDPATPGVFDVSAPGTAVFRPL